MSSEPTVLVVDDEPDLLDNIALALEVEDYRVLKANDGREALAILETETVDLILADIAMPELNGYQLYERIRQNADWITIPFVFLTARSMDSDIRYGKELGVDDYLTKPIRAGDLLAVVRGKLRRAKQLSQVEPAQANTQVKAAGRLRLDSEQHRVWLDNTELSLSAKEFALLEHLMRQAGNVASPQELVQLTHEFETDSIEAGNLIRPLILSVRRKLGLDEGEVGSIENVRGVGYRLVTK